MPRWLIALPMLCLPLCAFAQQRPPAQVPERDDAVVERLPAGYAALTPRATRNAPLPEQADRLIAIGARSGDARLVARASALLARIPDTQATPRILRARAYVAQYRHDFRTALELLDRAIRVDPRDGDARLARVQILLVQGHLDRARGDCASLALGVDSEHGLLCTAALAARRGSHDQAAMLLDRWLERPGRTPELYRHALVIRAEAASRRGDADADAWYAKARAAAPGDVRTFASMSRHLRSRGRPAEAYRLLVDAPFTDHLLLERALAAHAARLPEAKPLADQIGRRYAAAHSLGAPPDLRDEAEYLLTLRGQPDAALDLARRNFDEQRDIEDLDLLRRAARTAGAPEAWEPALAWARTHRLALGPIRDTAR